jgi:hypothetical protein
VATEVLRSGDGPRVDLDLGFVLDFYLVLDFGRCSVSS